MTDLHVKNILKLLDSLTELNDPAINDRITRILYDCSVDLLSITDPTTGLYSGRSVPRLCEEYTCERLDTAYDTDSEEIGNRNKSVGK